MNRQPTLSDATLTLRPMAATDRAGLFAAASQPETWAGHPAHDRWQPDVFNPYFDMLLASAETLVVLKDAQIIGCSRFYTPDEDPKGISIGYTFLKHTHWGGSTNRAMKTLMLTHAFKHHDTVWFHIATTNIRSQRATLKLGAICVNDGKASGVGDHGDKLAFTLSKADWDRTRGH